MLIFFPGVCIHIQLQDNVIKIGLDFSSRLPFKMQPDTVTVRVACIQEILERVSPTQFLISGICPHSPYLLGMGVRMIEQ